jgi:hypothetical protein
MRPLLLGLLLSLATTARATSHHQDVDVQPIKDDGGKTTGAKISAILSSSGHKFARFGILPPRSEMPAAGINLKKEIMDRASKKWLLRTTDHEVAGKSVEVVLEVDYKKAGLKAGSKVQLGSAWDDGPGSNQHLWGVEWQNNWGDPEIELPQ